jgi:hypothetical protein
VTSNRNAFGTTVKIRIGNQWYHRFHHGAAIFGQSIKPIHFGIGAALMIDEIRFTWLTGVTEAIYNVPANQLLAFREGNGTVVQDSNGGNTGGGAIVEKNFSQPNPFSDATTITFDLSSAGTLELHIFNTMGQEVYRDDKTLSNPGSLSFEWDGRGVANGVYFYTANYQTKQMTGKLIKR